LPVRERWETITIVGVGLIGGSIGLALKSTGRARRVIGFDRNPAHLELALRSGAIDQSGRTLETAVKEADLVVIATHVDRIPDLLSRIARSTPAQTLLTDAGSTKQAIHTHACLDPILASRFVPAHPIAGSESKGPAAAQADLFQNRTCVLTPLPNTPIPVLQEIHAFWSALGCRPMEMDPQAHDQALALTSHLPHLIAAMLALSVPVDHLPLAAGAYRDGTRVALSDTELWVAVFLQNREPILAALAQFQERLDRFVAALKQSDPSMLANLWNDAKTSRSQYSEPPAIPVLPSQPAMTARHSSSTPHTPDSFPALSQSSVIKPS
jgi:prephenate dehydrogenase